ncbi:helix-turn-helix domain-containing protein [Sphingopyxis sp. H050]|jgi:transcriptional regulator with XRE-family HTH domain|uniref:helix-turn-helix domain-containing protein n=1 Tax=Sphingopyxis sp. H050 TaxID=1759072 RepID=UPI0009EBFB08|nr:helix-turn-helix domain-containing protein [Sphingopyxis sp. H050]
MATMPNAVFQDGTSVASKRRSARRNAPLLVRGTTRSGDAIELLIHNISESGVLVESDAPLAIDERIDVELPHAGLVQARLVWKSGQLFGCQFDAPISPAAVSAAQLQSATDVRFGGGAGQPSDNFGARLHRLRIRKGLSQGDVAAQLGVSAPSISGWESGRSRPKHARLDQLADLLGVSPSELLEEPDSEDLQDIIDRSRELIARTVGTSQDNVRIVIEL